MGKFKADVYTASDYAGIYSSNLDCYYGYERGYCKVCKTYNDNADSDCADCGLSDVEWCFVAKFNDKEIVIPYSKLGLGDNKMLDVNRCLLKGIAWIFEKYKLTE